MALQSNNLVMMALGASNDAPQVPFQEPLLYGLVDGVHLRWAFPRTRGFPWYGYYLFRRPHEFHGQRCIRDDLSGLTVGPLGSNSVNLSVGKLSSDVELVGTDAFSNRGIIEFDLGGRAWLRLDLPSGDPAFHIALKIGCYGQTERKLKLSKENTSVDVLALDGNVVVASATAKGRAGTVVPVTLEADRITAVRISGGPAALVDLCIRPVALGLYKGWHPVPTCPQPLTLPMIHPDYPAQSGRENLDASWRQARDRVVYGPKEPWKEHFKELYWTMQALVRGGPPGPSERAMAHTSRAARNVAGVSGHARPDVTEPHVRSLHPLDLVLLGALHPPIAQMVGLYWADQTARHADVYDYLIVADHVGIGRGSAKTLLAVIPRNWHRVDGWICFARRAQSEPPVPPPHDVRVFSLPGGSFRANAPAGSPVSDCAGNVGITWSIELDELGFLKPGAAIFHHVWRDRQGDQELPAPSADATELATSNGPLLVSRPAGIPMEPPKYPGDWPPFPLNFVDFALEEGWYGYKVNAIDIFGRFSAKSSFAEWRQWVPAPNPKPWYYLEPLGDWQVHASSVRVLDTEPPPPPTAVEAWALDPKDPMTLQDRAYRDWRATLPEDVRNTLIGLRVRWRWTVAQQRQASDTTEFRIYWHPGMNPPADEKVSADGQKQWVLKDIADWEARCHVCRYTENFEELADDVVADIDENGRVVQKIIHRKGDRFYELFLPIRINAAPFTNGVPLNPTRADPIAYGQVTVTADDDTGGAVDRWPGAGNWASRNGNESRAASPVRVFRVLRDQPPPPEAVVDSDRVYATPAGWHGHSFYTFRWKPAANLKTHIHRAMDEAVFSADWANPRANLDPNNPEHLKYFPDPGVEPTWNAAKRAQVADAINNAKAKAEMAKEKAEVAKAKAEEAKRNPSDSMKAQAETARTEANEAKAQALALYRGLDDDALRLLAGLPGNEKAFTQLTIRPLEPGDMNPSDPAKVGWVGPDDPGNSDRRGPDDPENYAPRSALRCYIDQLDGRATNRYLYRASYVDHAHNPSHLGQVGTPVRLPNVVPPRAPGITKIVGGEREITLSWASNREPDLLEYRVFRATSAEDARDLRSMTEVAVLAADEVSARPAEVVWTDDSVRGLVEYWYRVVAIDRPDSVDPRGGGGNTSLPSLTVKARAVDTTPPNPPEWVSSAWKLSAGTPVIRLVWRADEPEVTCLVQRRTAGAGAWISISPKLQPTNPPLEWEYHDATALPGTAYEYRITAWDEAGNRSTAYNVRIVPAEVI